jgi:hypothetical protein
VMKSKPACRRTMKRFKCPNVTASTERPKGKKGWGKEGRGKEKMANIRARTIMPFLIKIYILEDRGSGYGSLVLASKDIIKFPSNYSAGTGHPLPNHVISMNDAN